VTVVIRELDSDNVIWFEALENRIQWRSIVNTVMIFFFFFAFGLLLIIPWRELPYVVYCI
jgi:hypothetical protein